MMDTQDPWLLHFTSVDNLRGIAEVGLLADAKDPRLSIECGEPGIKQRRRALRVPISPGGVVADYVPFYFAPRSPMLRRIHGGGVRSYQHGQRPLVYLVTRLSHVIAAKLPWVATDRNASIATARFTNEVQALAHHVDWEVMEAQQWANTVDDGSRKQRRMAELLIHSGVRWAVISHVYTYDEAMAKTVLDVIVRQRHRPPVNVRPHWYF